MSLRDRTISGIFWSLLQNISGRGITFIVMIVLARLLTPEIFGLIGMLMIFIQVSQVLVQAGFNEALIQKKDTDEEDYSSVFWINLVVSILIYAILFTSSPLIAAFYEQPVLIGLTRALALVFVINAFSYVQEARLRKYMRFKTLTYVHIPSTIIGGVISIAMALLDYGVWSLIALQLVTRLAYAIQIWIYAKWKPLFIFNKRKAKGLFSFGGKLMISGVINTVCKNSYLVVIGKFFPLDAVGYYQNANNLVEYPASTFTNAVGKVTFSSFSSIQNNNKKLKKGLKKVVSQSLFLICPAFILACGLANPLFRLIFTEKWLAAVPYFRLLCIVGVLWPLNVHNLSITKVKGRTDIALKLEILKNSVKVIGLIIAIPFGIYMVIISHVFSSFFTFFLNSYYTGRFIDYPILDQIKDLLPILLLNSGVGLSIFLVDHFLITKQTDLIRIIIGVILGLFEYIIVAKYLQFEAYIEISKLFNVGKNKTLTK